MHFHIFSSETTCVVNFVFFCFVKFFQQIPPPWEGRRCPGSPKSSHPVSRKVGAGTPPPSRGFLQRTSVRANTCQIRGSCTKLVGVIVWSPKSGVFMQGGFFCLGFSRERHRGLRGGGRAPQEGGGEEG